MTESKVGTVPREVREVVEVVMRRGEAALDGVPLAKSAVLLSAADGKVHVRFKGGTPPPAVAALVGNGLAEVVEKFGDENEAAQANAAPG